MQELGRILEHEDTHYRSVIVDEAQDTSPEGLRLIRAIAPDNQDNNLMIVGDAHQRIFRNPVTLSHGGIHIRGRSHV